MNTVASNTNNKVCFRIILPTNRPPPRVNAMYAKINYACLILFYLCLL